MSHPHQKKVARRGKPTPIATDLRLTKRPTTTATEKVISKTTRDATRAKILGVQRKYAGHTVTRSLSDPSVRQYLAAGDKRSKRKASEAMGESGAVTWLRSRTKRRINLSRPTVSRPFTWSFSPGVPWADAVAFHGSNVTDVTYWDGALLHIVEAKGGGSALSTGMRARIQRYDPDTAQMNPQKLRQSASPPRVSQRTLAYLIDIAYSMCASKSQDRRALVGKAILNAIESGKIEYLAVSTKVEPDDTHATVTVMDDR
ncbi:hypothetical protein GCM10010168_27680 [Actinoplanes ianthinogenes]|uniref:Uncharacterized protein n=1 Tax=Actinoplanes ianthinogenes TaxID=122358 RepID=A0ABM7LKX1_9ACTN|nr:hypothetical protein [Actinoplanes ianthinogenes]BCJ39909.1 hypothetical protein Aiant_05660 [Actinoplanes ianthinogenes]GGR08941.1 hypothetical protein GCM10010168_27680 [Actinoplanes ianthinogenes]